MNEESINIAQAPRKRRMSLGAKKNMVGWCFVVPALLFFIIFVIIPLCMSMYLGFFRTNIFFTDKEYVGFANFVRVFHDQIFWKSMLNVLKYVLYTVPISVCLAIGLAALVNKDLKGIKIFRCLFYMPSVTSAVAASTVWLWLMNPSTGVLNKFLEFFHLPTCEFLNHSSTALGSIAIITIWMGLGTNMVIFLAALQNMDTTLYEAASIDGASKSQIFFRITLPLLKPTIFFVTTTSLIGAFQLYDQVFVLTGGGPAGSTMTPVFLIYQNSFGQTAGNQAGYASAQSLVLFVIILISSVLLRRLEKED